MRKLFLLILTILVWASFPCFAATHYFDCQLSGDCAGGAGTSYRVAERDCNGSDGTKAYKGFSGHDDPGGFTSGDTYYVRGGTYDISSAVMQNAVYIDEDIVTLAAYPGESPILDSKEDGANRPNVYLTSCDGVTIDGLEIKDGGKSGINLIGNGDVGPVSNVTIKNCTIHGHVRSGISLWDGSYENISNVTIEYNEVYDNGFGYDGEAGISVQYVGSGIVIRYNICHDNGQPIYSLTGWTEESTDLWYASYTDHGLAGGTYGKLYIKCSGADGCVYGNQVFTKRQIAQRASYCNTTGGIGDYWIDTTNSRIYLLADTDPGQGYFCRSPSGAKYPDGNGITIDTNCGGTEIYGNICYNNGGSGINSANPHPDGDIKIYNNTCYNNGQQACAWLRGHYSTGGIREYSNRGNINIGEQNDNKVENNIMSDGFCYNLICYHNGQTHGTYTIDYNLYFNTGYKDVSWNDGSYLTFSEFVAATSHEDNGVSNDPSFVDAGNADFHLSSSASPAYDAGTTISGIVAEDIEGIYRPQGSAWDIGAYVYGTGAFSPPSPPTGLKIIGQ